MKTIYSQDQIVETKKLSRLIGGANNLLILFELMNFGEKSFNELKRMTDINSVTLSRKLAALKAEGLVDCHSCGKENRYFVTEKSDYLRPLIGQINKIVAKM